MLRELRLRELLLPRLRARRQRRLHMQLRTTCFGPRRQRRRRRRRLQPLVLLTSQLLCELHADHLLPLRGRLRDLRLKLLREHRRRWHVRSLGLLGPTEHWNSGRRLRRDRRGLLRLHVRLLRLPERLLRLRERLLLLLPDRLWRRSRGHGR